MAPPLDAGDIHTDNIPVILGAILTKQNNMDEKLDDIKQTLKEHDECLQFFKFSRCTILPWIGRNKYAIALLMSGISIYISTLDWVNRWLQWTFLPPKAGP